MKRILSVLTFSLLASATNVHAKFILEDVLQEEDLFKLTNVVHNRLQQLDRKAECIQDKSELFSEEKRALERVIIARVGQNIYDESKRLIPYSILSSYSFMKDEHYPGKDLSNRDFIKLHTEISSSYTSQTDNITFKPLLSFNRAVKQYMKPDVTLLKESLDNYNGAFHKRKSIVKKFEPEAASIESIKARFEYLSQKEALLYNNLGEFTKALPFIKRNPDLQQLQDIYKVLIERKRNAKASLEKANNNVVSCDSDLRKRSLSIDSEGNICFKNTPLLKNNTFSGSIEPFIINEEIFASKIIGAITNGSEKRMKVFLFYKGKCIDDMNVNDGKFYGYVRDEFNYHEFNPSDIKFALFDDMYNYNYLEVPQDSIQLFKNDKYLENALSLRDDTDLYEFNRPLDRNPDLRGEVKPTYEGERILTVDGVCGIKEGEPAAFIAALYKDEVIVTLNIENKSYRNRSGNSSGMDKKCYFSGGVYLYNLEGDFDPSALKFIGIDNLGKYNFLNNLPAVIKVDPVTPPPAAIPATFGSRLESGSGVAMRELLKQITVDLESPTVIGSSSSVTPMTEEKSEQNAVRGQLEQLIQKPNLVDAFRYYMSPAQNWTAEQCASNILPDHYNSWNSLSSEDKAWVVEQINKLYGNK